MTGSRSFACPTSSYGAAATAAHQIEGNNITADLWMAEQAGTPPFSEPSGDACDSHRLPRRHPAARTAGGALVRSWQ